MKINIIALVIIFLGWQSISHSQACIVAHYDFNGNANDVSGNANHGVSFNATLTTDRFGNPNQAYLFNGTSSYIELNNNNAILTNALGFTITGWAKMNGTGGGSDVQNPLFVQRTDPTGAGNAGFALNLENSSGNLAFGGRGDGGLNAQSVSVAAQAHGAYHHYAAVLDNNEMRLYVDGIEVASAPYIQDGNINTNIDYVFIGKNRYLGTDAGLFNGVIDEVKIFDCALTDEEIQNLFSGECNPVAEYDFDNDADDVSGNLLHGVNNGATLTVDRLGNPNQAYSFDGVNDFIELNNSNPVITNSNSFTITTWAKMNGVGGGADIQNTVFVQRTDATGAGNAGWALHLENSTGNISFGGRGDGGGAAQSVSFPAESYGSYHHYVGVLEGNEMRLYVDGIEVASAPFVNDGSLDANIDYVFIGKNRYLGFDAGQFNGVIDYVNIYNCALTDSEILDMATLKISELSLENSILVYPNPTTGMVTVDLNSNSIQTLSVFDVTGKLIVSVNENNSVNLTDYVSGFYYLVIEQKGGIFSTVKLIKE